MTAEPTSITLRLFGPVRNALGCKDVTLAWTEGMVTEALFRFVEEHGAPTRPFLFDSQGDLWKSLIVLVNDEPVADPQTTRVRAGDTISILLPLAGGSEAAIVPTRPPGGTGRSGSLLVRS